MIESARSVLAVIGIIVFGIGTAVLFFLAWLGVAALTAFVVTALLAFAAWVFDR